MLKGSCGRSGELRASREWGCVLWGTPQKCLSRVYLQEEDPRNGRRPDWVCRSGSITEAPKRVLRVGTFSV